MNFSELMFYAEANGLLPTRTGKIEAVINEMKKNYYSIMDFPVFNQILEKNGLSYDQLTDKEIQYITAKLY